MWYYIAPQVKMLESDWLRAGQHFTLVPASLTMVHMATIMTNIQQDKSASIFLIMDVFGILNIEIDCFLANPLMYSVVHSDI